jgi:hypothetical protein
MADALATGFAAALAVLNGSKESIHGAAQLILHAPEWAAPSLCAQLCARAAELQEHAARLRLVYVANDVLFAAQRGAQLHAPGASLSALLHALPTLLRLTAELAPDAAAAAKLVTLVEFWRSHGVVDGQCAAVLHASVAAPPQYAVTSAPAPAQLTTEPAFPAGLIGALVRQRRQGSHAADVPYTVLAPADVAVDQTHAVAEEYLSARLTRFYDELQRGSGKVHQHAVEAGPHDRCAEVCSFVLHRAFTSLLTSSSHTRRFERGAPPVPGASAAYVDGSVAGRGTGHGGLGTQGAGDASAAFRKSRSAAYHTHILSGR